MTEQHRSPGGTDAAAFWNAKFAATDYLYGTEPNAWLVSRSHLLSPGSSTLVIGDGEGRNGVWLASRGLDVTAVDASERGLAKAKALADERGVKVRQVLADLTGWAWPIAEFDAAVSIFVHFDRVSRPIVHRAMLAALKPGGRLLLEGYTPYQHLYRTGGPQDLDMLVTAWRLRQDFEGAEIVELEETEADLSEGHGHRGRSAVVRLIARKP